MTILKFLFAHPKVIAYASIPIGVAILMVFVPADSLMKTLTTFTVFMMLIALFGSFLSLLFVYGKMTHNAYQAIKMWNEMALAVKVLSRETYNLHEALTAVIRFGELAPHTIRDAERDTEAGKDYSTGFKAEDKEETNVEEWELPPRSVTHSDDRVNGVSVS